MAAVIVPDVKCVKVTLCVSPFVPDADNSAPVFVNPAPLPKNDVAVTDVIPEIFVCPSNPPVPTKSPPMKTLFAIPTPPSITTAPLVVAGELRVLLNLAS